MALWEWDYSPEARNGKCTHCNEPMLYGRNSAVRYQGKIYHSHCLLTFLAEYHQKNTSNTVNLYGSDVQSDFPWGGP